LCIDGTAGLDAAGSRPARLNPPEIKRHPQRLFWQHRTINPENNMAHHLHREQRVRASLEEVWTFFSDPRNLDTLTPPDLAFRIIGDPAAGMYPGQMIEYRIRFVKGLWSKWLTEITHVEEPHFFIDEQRIGPYKLWHHEHRFIQQGEEILLVDHVTYVVGFGLIGDLLARLWINRKLAWIFDFRQRKTTGLFGSSRLAD